MKDIDTKACPVYMLTGEYGESILLHQCVKHKLTLVDWSNTPAMSQATCDKIPGGKHQAMKGLGHFPAVSPSSAVNPVVAY